MAIKLHNLPGDKGLRQKVKRRGRGEGSGLGRTAGKGNKGHRARSGGSKGGSFEGGQMPLTRRLPKFGFKNTAFRAQRDEVTTGDLERFDAGAVIDQTALAHAGLVSKNAGRVKVIVKGGLTKKLTVRAHGFSAGAKAAIEAAGGQCETVES